VDRASDPGGDLPLSARDALAGLLLRDLGAAPASGSSVARALEILALGAGAGPPDDEAGRRAHVALARAGLVAAASRAAGIPAASRDVACRERTARQRLRAYADVLRLAPAGSGLPARLAQAGELLAARLFFEVHEVLEPAWRCASGRSRELLQGMIQAAVAWYHAERGNRSGATRQASSSRARLAAAPPSWLGFPLGALRAAIDASAVDLAQGGGGVPDDLSWARRARAG
jgi:hypothetical protein